MIDSFGRKIEYLRISITDRCNLRCQYCMPEEGIAKLKHDEILSFSEIQRVVKIFAKLGVKRIRLTGGEPLVRKGIEELARDIKSVPGIAYLGITTNGVLLNELGEPLKKAGVDGLNISLDTMDAARYHTITRRDEFAKAMAGIDLALALSFNKVKLNCVLSPQSETQDWMSVVEFAKENPVDVRLIEWMPMAGEDLNTPVSAKNALKEIEKQFGKAEQQTISHGAGPAIHYSLPNFKGRLGIIPAMTHNFCESCNRVRITASGELKLCLFYDEGIALKPLLRGGATDEEIAKAIQHAITHKPERHYGVKKRVFNEETDETIKTPQGMAAIGG